MNKIKLRLPEKMKDILGRIKRSKEEKLDNINLENSKFNKLKRSLKAFFTSSIFKKTIVVLIIFVALVQVILAVLIYGFKSESKVTRVVARVIPFPVAIANQDFVTYNSYLKEKDYIHHFYSATQQTGIDYTQVDHQILDQLIEDDLIAFQAMKHNIKITNSDIDNTVNQIVDQNGGQDKVEQVLNELYGLNLNQFKKLVQTQLIRQKFSDDAIMKITASHVLIRVDQKATQEQIDAAKAKITDIRNQIESGSISFADAATKYSEDTGSASNGGKLDPFAPGDMVKEFSEAAFATPVGKISQPIRSEYGWHIIKVESKTGNINESFTDWLSGIKKKSLILKFYK